MTKNTIKISLLNYIMFGSWVVVTCVVSCSDMVSVFTSILIKVPSDDLYSLYPRRIVASLWSFVSQWVEKTAALSKYKSQT